MIKSVELVELPLFDKQDSFIRVELDDECLMFNEEELKNAAALAEKGCLDA